MCNRDKAVDEARKKPNEPPGPKAGCPNGCEKETLQREGSIWASQTITNSLSTCERLHSPPVIVYETCRQKMLPWNNQSFNWPVKFMLVMNRIASTLTVKVRLYLQGTVTDAQKAAWKAAIESKWNNKVKLLCPDTNCPCACGDGYRVVAEVVYVDRAANAHQTVTAAAPGDTTGGRSGNGGTSSMTAWGAGDTVDITHEFGHMLGNTDEYFTTNGVDYTYGGTKSGSRDADGGVMNNPSNNPFPRNYEVIRQEAAKLRNSLSCTIVPITP